MNHPPFLVRRVLASGALHTFALAHSSAHAARQCDTLAAQFPGEKFVTAENLPDLLPAVAPTAEGAPTSVVSSAEVGATPADTAAPQLEKPGDAPEKISAPFVPAYFVGDILADKFSPTVVRVQGFDFERKCYLVEILESSVADSVGKVVSVDFIYELLFALKSSAAPVPAQAPDSAAASPVPARGTESAPASPVSDPAPVAKPLAATPAPSVRAPAKSRTATRRRR